MAIHERKKANESSYLEGAVLLDNGTPNSWLTSFFPQSDIPKVTSLVKKYGIIYSAEIAQNFNEHNEEDDVHKEMEDCLSSKPDYIYVANVSYTYFLSNKQLQPEQHIAHPWLDLFVPRSGVEGFNSGVFRDIVLKRNITTQYVLFYPMIRTKWDNRTSAVIPDDNIFYLVGLLYTSGVNNYTEYEDQNKAILEYCDEAGIQIKQYLANIETKEKWIEHFGSKWSIFSRRKALFDPKMILSPGQRIFNN